MGHSRMKMINTANEKAVNQAMRQAGLRAIKAHFYGEGRERRALHFLRESLVRSLTWSLVLVSLVCTSMVLGVTVGPGHEAMLQEFHAWMVGTPFDLVLQTAKSWVVSFGGQCLVGGVIAGFLQKLMTLAKPAMDMTRSELASGGQD